MKQYLDLCQSILDRGNIRGDRTGTGTIGTFGNMMKFNMADGFPLVTTKRTWFRGIAIELLWFISGSTNVKPLIDQNVSIWTAWAMENWIKKTGRYTPNRKTPEGLEEWNKWQLEFEDKIRNDKDGRFTAEYGDLGQVYGKQWRKWLSPDGTLIDQLAESIRLIKEEPNSRRNIVNAWNPADLHDVALPWCHSFFQFYVTNGRLDLVMYQRSADVFLGVPFNIASYALLLQMVAQVTGLVPGEFTHFLGDTHIYSNLVDQVKEQLTRTPLALPKVELNPEITNIDDFKYEDIMLIGYKSHETIKGEVAV